MPPVTVKAGFVGSYRFSFSEWCRRMFEESLAAFGATEGLEVVVPEPLAHGAVHTLDEAERAAELFARQKVDALIVCPLDFGDERSAAKVAERLGVPIFLYATREPPARTDASLARLSDSYCGNLALAAALYRRRLPFHYAGLFLPHEPALAGALATFVRAVAVRQGLTGARIGQVGLHPEPFESCGFSERELIRKFRQNVICRELSQLTGAARDLADDDPRVTALVEEIRGGVEAVTVPDEHLRDAAKLELSLADFWHESGLSAMAVQCWPSVQRDMGVSVCAVFGRLTERGMLTACEADVIGALSMLASHRAALGETVPHFIDWTIQHREDPDVLLAWHCGNAPLCLAAHPGRTALRSRRDMAGEQAVPESDPQAGLYQFQLKPGPVTFCRLAEQGGEWKMLIAPGEIEPSDEELAGTWSWVRVPDQARLYRTLVEEGFIHHASMVHGDRREALKLACKLMDIRPVVVE